MWYSSNVSNFVYFAALLTNLSFEHLYLVTSMFCQQWLSRKPDLMYRLIHHLVNNEQALKYDQMPTPFYYRKDA